MAASVFCNLILARPRGKQREYLCRKSWKKFRRLQKTRTSVIFFNFWMFSVFPYPQDGKQNEENDVEKFSVVTDIF